MQRIREGVGRAQAQQFLRSAHREDVEDKDAFGTSKNEQIRMRVHRIVDQSDSSWYAAIFSGLIVTFIVVSVVAFCVETIPSLEFTYETYWFNLEAAVIGVFSVEYAARLWSSPTSWSEFCLNVMNIIDLLSIAPFYVYLIMSATSPVDFFMLRVFRLFRLIQVLKLARYSKMMNLIFQALLETRHVLVILLSMLLITTILYSSLICLAEKGQWDATLGCYTTPERVAAGKGCSPFDSVPSSIYWGITTLTGVGYGDVFPVTAWGKAIASFAMVTGVLALALPVVLIGVHMSNTMVFLKSEIESKQGAHKVESEELFQVVYEFDHLCQRIAFLSLECQRLVLGSYSCRLRDPSVDDSVMMSRIIDHAKPAEILSSRMEKKYLDLKKYVNSVDINDKVNKLND